MCGRGALDADIQALVDELGLDTDRVPAELPARFNIAPSYNGTGAPVIARAVRGSEHAGARELVQARFWFIPRFWNKPLKQLPTSFNARAEDVADKPFFKQSFTRRRCLMPVTGWYEFSGERGKKRSFYFSLPDRKLCALAGIYDTWISPDGEVVTSFAVITTNPNDVAAAFHDRMPVVLERADYARWLDPSSQDPAELRTLLRPWPHELRVYETSGYGNDPTHEGPACLEPAPARRPEPRTGDLFDRLRDLHDTTKTE